jgi:hypothetical protein
VAEHLEHRFAPKATGDSAIAVFQHPWFVAGFRHNRRVNRRWAIQFDPLGCVVPLQFWHQAHARGTRERDRGDAIHYLRARNGVL